MGVNFAPRSGYIGILCMCVRASETLKASSINQEYLISRMEILIVSKVFHRIVGDRCGKVFGFRERKKFPPKYAAAAVLGVSFLQSPFPFLPFFFCLLLVEVNSSSWCVWFFPAPPFPSLFSVYVNRTLK